MTGKHIRRKKHILRFVIGILVVGLGIFCYFLDGIFEIRGILK